MSITVFKEWGAGIMADKIKILVADDDPAIVNILETTLALAGYEVICAGNGNEALEKARAALPQLIIMDVMMPGCNGIVATMRIREESNVPILMLSAKAEGSDRVIGLEAGADDYLVKPFLSSELLARVKALLRRYNDLGSARDNALSGVIAIGDIRLDTQNKQLSVRGDTVRLTATEYRILQLLMSHPGRVFSAEEIYEKVWNSDAFAVENTVMVHINRIRGKIEIDPRKPEYLKVIWGIGYVFEKK